MLAQQLSGPMRIERGGVTKVVVEIESGEARADPRPRGLSHHHVQISSPLNWLM